MTVTPEDVFGVIDDLVGFVLRYAVTLAAISALSMALIEMFKGLFSWRDRFHKKQLLTWIRSAAQQDSVDRLREWPSDPEWTPPHDGSQFCQRVYEQLLQLTTGEPPDKASIEGGIEWMPWDVSSGNALFALSLDKMMGQIQDAADTAMSNPRLYPELYVLLTAGARAEDAKNWCTWANEPPMRSTQDAMLAKMQADTYARLRQFIRRKLDAFQVTASYRWQTGNQIASMCLGTLLLFGSLAYLATLSSDNWFSLVFASLLGGIMAPVAKDLVVALKRVRSGG